MDQTRYASRGVSSSKEEVHRAIEVLDKGLFPGAFCKIVPDIAGNPAYGSIDHLDGAGTKAIIPYMAMKEGFGNEIWTGIAQDSLVMNIDDVACAGATGRMHITQLINRNKFLIPAEAVSAIISGCKDFCVRMKEFGFDMVYVSGETADVPDSVRTIVVDNGVSTRIRLRDVIDASRMVPGDIIVGFSSTGQAKWESGPNAGLGANGYTNARHDVLSNVYAEDTETYAPQVPKDLVFRGKYRLTDPLPGDSRFTIGSALLSPTRTYLPLIRKLLALVDRNDVHGLIHCSGGGQTKIGKFGAPGNVYVKHNPFPVPPVFSMLKEASGLPWKEMYSTFNMGHRLEAVVTEHAVHGCLEAAEWAGIEARVVGQVEHGPVQSKNPVFVVVKGEGTISF